MTADQGRAAERPGDIRAGILVTGTEVITGRISDRNGPWISERLAELGIEVAQIIVVADRPADLEAALRFLAAEGCDLIVTSGGLGPTADDLTAEIVARFAGRPMVLDRELERRIGEIVSGFTRRLRFDPEAMREGTRKQAMVPEGATPIDPAGTAPGLVVAGSGGPVIVVMPGPPRELHAMWPQALATPDVRAVIERAAPAATRTIRMFGVTESEVAKTLREVEAEVDLEPLEITTCLRRGELEIDVRHRPGGEQATERLVAELARRHGRALFSTDGASVDEQVAELLSGRTIALAESSTGGMLAARLTDLPGASAYLAGSIVAYSNAAKISLLGVDPDLIDAHGAVSRQVAEAMARGAIERFGADVTCAISGIAGPGGATEAKPVGYTCIDVREASGRTLARDPVIPGDRAEVRERTTTVALHMLRRLLAGEELDD
ncbi:MAG TPA: competence/damage-inducible protein A [Solirubrobacterales bacterium]|nr:competence/damage-inducible protein A [Solirubrobacterales bacterium]